MIFSTLLMEQSIKLSKLEIKAVATYAQNTRSMFDKFSLLQYGGIKTPKSAAIWSQVQSTTETTNKRKKVSSSLSLGKQLTTHKTFFDLQYINNFWLFQCILNISASENLLNSIVIKTD